MVMTCADHSMVTETSMSASTSPLESPPLTTGNPIPGATAHTRKASVVDSANVESTVLKSTRPANLTATAQTKSTPRESNVPLVKHTGKVKPVQITISSTYGVQTEPGGLVAHQIPRFALLAIAALTEAGKTEVHVNNREFVRLTYRSAKKVADKMYKMRKALSNKGIQVDHSGGVGETFFRGYRVTFTPPLNREQLTAWLAEQPPRARNKPSVPP